MYSVKSPVLLLMFNRPEETLVVFNAIREAKPSRLYIAQDGPRTKDGELELCDKTRQIILKIDWDCEFKTLIRTNNLGCKIAVSEAISWFFENEKEGIILEDDCFPSNDFFKFCDDNLERYRYDNRIGHISGSNFQFGNNFGSSDSYYFSKLFDIWGWATWRRVWLHYDVNMENLYFAIKYDFYKSVTDNSYFKNYFYGVLQDVKDNKINTWDYQYTFQNSIQGFLSIFPQNNMISNIGFNENATHTVNNKSPVANLQHMPLPLNIIHPKFFIANKLADEFTINRELPLTLRRIIGVYKKKFSKRWKLLLCLN